ncbi:MAG: hypothetical protein ACI9O6_000269 [Glaciecola sp.]
MNKLSVVATYIVRKLWTLVAITLVVFALLMSLLRYSLPLLNDKKEFFEEYASIEYGVDLKIESISASWQGVGPALVLEGVTLEQSDRSPIELNISNIYVEIDFWDSLLTQQISSKNFSLDGLLLDVDLQRIQSSNNDYPILDALEGLFLEQLQSFSLVNSEVTISGANNRQSFDIANLSWLNKGDRHQGSGLISVSELASNSAVFVIDLKGRADDFDGTIYAKADELDVSPWINEFSALESELLEGRANFEFWADINRKSITKVYGNIKPTRFIWKQEVVDLTSGIESGVFVAQPSDDGWLFNVNDLTLSVYDKTLITNWRGSLSKQGELQVQSADDFSIKPLLPIVGLFSADLLKQLNMLSPESTVSELAIQSRLAGFAAHFKLNEIEWNKSEGIPGVKGLNADLYWHKNVGAIRVEGSDVDFISDNIFPESLSIDNIDMPIQFYQSDDDWIVRSTSGVIELPETQITPQFEYHVNQAFLSLAADIGELEVSSIRKFLPLEPYLGDGVSKYVNNAFIERGKISSAQVLWYGQFSQFPFDQNEGVFQASIDIEDADFSFSKDWTSIEGLDLNIGFENLALTMQSSKATINGIKIDKLRGFIPMLVRGADLIIEANATGSGAALSQLLLNSSLSEGLGKTLSNDILVSHDLSTQLSLHIPLDEPAKTSASGIVTLKDNFVRIPKLLLELDKVNGQVSFDNDKVVFSKLKADLLEQPLIADFKGASINDEYRFDVSVEGDWELSPLVPQVSSELGEYVNGRAAWNSSINVAIGKDDFTYMATVFSKLDKVNSILPVPFDKKEGDKKTIKLIASGNKQASNIKLALGDMVNFDGILPHKELQFSRAHLAIGETDFVGRGVGFSISANLPQIHLATWYQSISALLAGGIDEANADKKPLFEAPQRIFIETDNLILAGQALTDVDATVKTVNKDWILDVMSDEAKAQITFHDRWTEEGIEINADFVRFDNWVEQEEQLRPEIEPQSLPRIRVNCRDCQIFGNRLGEVKFESFPNDDGLRLEDIQINGPNGSIRANGQWYKRNGDHYTFINGDLKSGDFGGFLKDFQFDSGIKDSEAQMDFAFTWKASPLDFSFDYLDGEMQWELSDGYITELSDKGSRIFTLLSLDSLVRKLSLDFRDVFAQGFFYDEMQGSLQITEGKADTRDTKIDGGAGEMEIYGYTDLVTKELNYNVSFTPNVTGNLPVLVYFMVNPPTALAALALDQVLTSAKVISNVNYSITGSINEPILVETGRESTEVALPARRDELPIPNDEFIPPTPEDTLMMEVNDGS